MVMIVSGRISSACTACILRGGMFSRGPDRSSRGRRDTDTISAWRTSAQYSPICPWR